MFFKFHKRKKHQHGNHSHPTFPWINAAFYSLTLIIYQPQDVWNDKICECIVVTSRRFRKRKNDDELFHREGIDESGCIGKLAEYKQDQWMNWRKVL